MKLKEVDLWKLRYLSLAADNAVREGQAFIAELRKKYRMTEQQGVDLNTGEIR